MCGIFLCIKRNDESFSIEETSVFLKAFNLLTNRGPDSSIFSTYENKIFGFKRLSINDLSLLGNQPFFAPFSDDENFTQLSMCNGEIYNHKFLEQKYNLQMQSQSDCECILPLYQHSMQGKNTMQMKVTKFFQQFDGVFSMIVYDKETNSIVFGRDKIGVKPLFYLFSDSHFIIASEAKVLNFIKSEIGNKFKSVSSSGILELNGSQFGIYNISKHQISLQNYYSLNSFQFSIGTQKQEISNITDQISKLNVDSSNENSLDQTIQLVHDCLVNAVKKRTMSDRPVGCLLSGGVDSSIIASILAKIYKESNQKIKTFSIGFPDSTDIKYAREVAAFIGSDHHEYIIDYETAIKAIPDVIYAIETYDITTIRASTPMYLLCKWIKENFSETVIFSGEGSDELFGGYLYFHNCPNEQEFQNETIRLLEQLPKYDVLRAERCTSSNSLELREPFLDINLIELVLSINPNWKLPQVESNSNLKFEKFILRKAFTNNYLPDHVLWRRKAAFSDAVSSSVKPWYKYIQENAEQQVSDQQLQQMILRKGHNLTKESAFYLKQFEFYYSHFYKNVEYWLPKWQQSTNLDPSATTLHIFNPSEH